MAADADDVAIVANVDNFANVTNVSNIISIVTDVADCNWKSTLTSQPTNKAKLSFVSWQH